MIVNRFIHELNSRNISFFTGVPDSQLKALCDYLNTQPQANNITAANEGNATAIAAGYYLATGKIPCVYLQNSGLGNIINPYASLLNDNVYAIPVLFVVGWRGEPNVSDEPQHIFQGRITKELLKISDISYFVLSKETTEEELKQAFDKFGEMFKIGKSCAVIVKKGALESENKVEYKNSNSLVREDVISLITKYSKEDIIISTTGKTSRELFEIRKNAGQEHKYDFLTVGSMGHCSSIALGIALNKPETNVWCIDGDGSVLMHMGAIAVIGEKSPSNFIHIVINNSAHESVGGMPTVADKIDLKNIATSCGYKTCRCVSKIDELKAVLVDVNAAAKPLFIEVKTAIGSREDLGRPTKTPAENKEAFMKYLEEKK